MSSAKLYIMVFNQMHKFSGLGHIVINDVIIELPRKIKFFFFLNPNLFCVCLLCCLWKIIAFSLWHINSFLLPPSFHEVQVFGRSFDILMMGSAEKINEIWNKEMSSKICNLRWASSFIRNYRQTYTHTSRLTYKFYILYLVLYYRESLHSMVCMSVIVWIDVIELH